MIKPNFFMVGAPRCATTSMYTYLKQHPDIFLSLLKEPIYFGSDLTRQPLAITEEAHYLSLFAGAGNAQVVGEGSVFYIMSKRAPQELKDFSPAARILIMLRDPVDMMHSLHSLYLRTGNEALEDFEDALEAEATRAQGQRLPPRCYFPEGLQYRSVAHYAEPVERFLRTFGPERVHVLLFDDLVRDTAGEYRRTLEFLGVDPHHPVELDVDKATELIRPLVLKQMRAASQEVRQKLKTGRDSHRGPRSKPVSAALRARLHEELRPDVERLSTLLNRDLSHWCKARPS
ncbi:sulfotransferase family protein [Stigmatella aurantiaca]|uniref:Sulfotransferase protein n=2 Tax=Stigmatella aurantiaca (strain DW4/3-1) TaxID=378806 RepID=E3FRK8_STIAD|nr:sulfotransferase [Stigmatella aurantiaca]ADO75785.1 sulfotransferase protein [Stigmatella aurantiaca DW4/3-1]